MEVGPGPKEVLLKLYTRCYVSSGSHFLSSNPFFRLKRGSLQQKLGESCGKTHLSKQVKITVGSSSAAQPRRTRRCPAMQSYRCGMRRPQLQGRLGLSPGEPAPPRREPSPQAQHLHSSPPGGAGLNALSVTHVEGRDPRNAGF